MTTIDPPYRLDPLQNIVNVKWSELLFSVNWFITVEYAGDFIPPLSCEPVDHESGDALTISQSTVTMTYTIHGPFNLPYDPVTDEEATIDGSVSISPTVVSFGSWEVGPGPFPTPFGDMPGATVEGTSATFDIVGILIEGGPGCYGGELGATGGIQAGGIAVGPIPSPTGQSIMITSSVTGAHWKGVDYEVKSTTIFNSAEGQQFISIVFEG